MIVKVTRLTVRTDPTFRSLDLAYPESTTATAVSASAAVNEWPEASEALLNGPSEGLPTSTPSRVKLLDCGRLLADWPNVVVLSVSMIPPAAAVTPGSRATSATFDSVIPSCDAVSWSIVWPAALVHVPSL
jgi:hypothetical protein